MASADRLAPVQACEAGFPALAVAGAATRPAIATHVTTTKRFIVVLLVTPGCRGLQPPNGGTNDALGRASLSTEPSCRSDRGDVGCGQRRELIACGLLHIGKSHCLHRH